MKCIANFLSLGLVATCCVSAAPALARQGDDGLDIYQLKISSPLNPGLDGRYLSLSGSALGLYDRDDVSPVQVYQTESEKAGCKQLHTYPIGIVDHSLGLVGPKGLLAFVDLVNPRNPAPNYNGTIETWDTFRTDDDKVTNDAEGRWLAFPGADNSWLVKWADGSAFTTADYMPVELVYESVGTGR